jgi:hypothetical protein
MKHVIDIDETGTDADVLTETGGGLIKRSLLGEEPLVAHLDDDEEPRYVLRNKKQGVTVDRKDGTEEYAPVGRYSGLAVVTDVRLLFVVGGSDQDRRLSLSLADIVDVRTEDGVVGSKLVAETEGGAAYRFPCKGDLAEIVEYFDAAAGIWRRAEQRIERAEREFKKLQDYFESGDADVVLAATADVRETLDAARREAEPLPTAHEKITDHADTVEAHLADLERRAHSERAEQARERAHVRWDDHEFEAAFDHLDDAAEAYRAAIAVDAAEPSEDLLKRRCETLSEECSRLAAAPVERAEHAVDVATEADDPESTIDWWEAAVDRYETALSLDWGRDERRFDGDPDALREELANAAEHLVEAYCDLAREHIEADGEDGPADSGTSTVDLDLATQALDDARAVARERFPEATVEIERVQAQLDEYTTDDGTEPTASAPTTVEASTGPVAGRETRVDHDGQLEPNHDLTASTKPANEGDRHSNGAAVQDQDADTDGTGADADPDGTAVGDEEAPATLEAVDPEQFTNLVSAVFRETGWTTTLFGTSRESQYDLLAETDGPIGVTACVWTFHPESVEAVDAARIERYAAHLTHAEEGDAAAVCSMAPLSETARKRADEHGVEVLDADDLREMVAEHGIDLAEF